MNKESILITDSGEFSEQDICNGLAQLGATQYELEEAQKLIIGIFNMFACGVESEIVFDYVKEYCEKFLTKEQKGELYE